MKYYKLILNNQVVGAINSNNFVYYQPITGCFLLSDEENGEYIDYNGVLYRATWMRPATEEMPFTQVRADEITEEQYQIYIDAIEHDTIIDEDEDEEVIPPSPQYIDPDELISIDFIRSSKLTELSRACRAAIESGIDLELHGETHHFSLTTQDQLNLMSLGATAQTQDLIPYHADGELYTYYTAAEINSIIKAANDHKVYHTAYYNSLKAYVNALTTIEEIATVTYGTEVPEEYKSDVLRVLE